jgi:hypothetical protein
MIPPWIPRCVEFRELEGLQAFLELSESPELLESVLTRESD